MSMPTDHDLIDFVYHEARLLDERRWEDWLGLYAEDAHYWMPLVPGQDDPILHSSLLYEDKLLLRVRVERLMGQRTFSQQPHSRGHRLLQRPTIEREHPGHQPEQGRFVVRTSFHYVETRGDAQTLYAGWATHHLVWQDGLRIHLKRVDLVNCDAAFANIQLFM